MIIKSVRVKNFRSIRDETISCDELTILLGPNGSGKSAFLRALDLFYTPTALYDENDFYNRDTSQEISISVTFTLLTNQEMTLFQNYVEGEELVVEKLMAYPSSRANQRYYGWSLINPEFAGFRNASGSDLKREYTKLLEGNYSSLPPYTRKELAEDALKAWEVANPSRCSRKRDDGQFFGFSEVGQSRLERFTKFIPIPAVRNAADDASEIKGSTLKDIMDLVVKRILLGKPEVGEFRERTQEEYRAIFQRDQLPELTDLEDKLNRIMKTYVPDAGVELDWDIDSKIDIPFPSASALLIEDNFPALVQSCGHGLQRAYILTVFQFFALAQAQLDSNGETEDSGEPNIVVAIEEPELYQHPSRQRRLAQIFRDLSNSGIDGVVGNMQILYSTHSPLLVNLPNFSQIRCFKKVTRDPDLPKETRIVSSSLDSVADLLNRARQSSTGSWTGDQLQHKLKTLMTPWLNEGFFADLAVLVEGDKDRGIILGVAAADGIDLEAQGASIIPCKGKSNLCKAYAIFNELDIDVYPIWDSDRGSGSSNENLVLLRLLGQQPEPWPNRIENEFACFETTLEESFKDEIGELIYRQVLSSAKDEFEIEKENVALSNPHIVQFIVNEARNLGATISSVELVVEKIALLTQ